MQVEFNKQCSSAAGLAELQTSTGTAGGWHGEAIRTAGNGFGRADLRDRSPDVSRHFELQGVIAKAIHAPKVG
jgi:hypothetical protein